MAKYVIYDILDWERDRWRIAGDRSRMPEDELLEPLAKELERAEADDWPGLPFECEAESEEDAIGQYADQECYYIRPLSAHIELINQ